jgi:PIN domain nuclease of toxin-antitoxin system
MKLLLDTQAWLWFVLGHTALSPAARTAIEDPNSEKLVSPASFWEIAIKISLGKYVLPQPYERFIESAIYQQGFSILPILPKHAAIVSELPFHQRDPFDRMIVAQALAEGMTLVSRDMQFDAYGISRIW